MSNSVVGLTEMVTKVMWWVCGEDNLYYGCVKNWFAKLPFEDFDVHSLSHKTVAFFDLWHDNKSIILSS